MPAGAPRDVEVKEIFVKSVKLYWKIVRPNLQYGEQRRYLVMLEKLRTEDIRRFEYPVSDQSKVEYHKWLPELTGLTEYELNISLINVVGEGPIATLTFTTKEGGRNHTELTGTTLVDFSFVHLLYHACLQN